MCELAVFSKKMGRWVKKAENLLLEQDGSETSVERTNTLVLEHLGESTNQAIGVGIRVASSGHNAISAKNSASAEEAR
jgi:hypothetical protein